MEQMSEDRDETELWEERKRRTPEQPPAAGNRAEVGGVAQSAEDASPPAIGPAVPSQAAESRAETIEWEEKKRGRGTAEGAGTRGRRWYWPFGRADRDG